MWRVHTLPNELTQREVASQRRRLARCSDPLTYASIIICTLKRELFEARDQGEDSETRASGECLCIVCGDCYLDHASTYCPSAVGICTGQRFKL